TSHSQRGNWSEGLGLLESKDVRSKQFHQAFDEGVRFLVIDIHPERGTVLLYKCQVSREQHRFFEDDFLEVPLFCFEDPGIFQFAQGLLARVSDSTEEFVHEERAKLHAL